MLYKEAVGSIGPLSNSSQNNLQPRYRGEARGQRQLGVKRLRRSATLNAESCSDGLVEYSLSLFKTCGGFPSRIRPLLAIWENTQSMHCKSDLLLCWEAATKGILQLWFSHKGVVWHFSPWERSFLSYRIIIIIYPSRLLKHISKYYRMNYCLIWILKNHLAQ